MAGGRIVYDGVAAGPVFDRVQELLATFPVAAMPTCGLHHDEDGRPRITFLLGIVDGSDPEPIYALLRRDLPILEDELGPKTYLELQALAGILPFGLRHFWKGHFLRDLDRAGFVGLVDAVCADDAVGDAFILLEALTGVGRTEPGGVGAAFGQRAARWNASALAIWEDPALDDVAISWARRVADLVEPLSLKGGGYVNYSTEETPDRVPGCLRR